MNKIILHAEDLDGFLTEEDKSNIQAVHTLYDKSLDACSRIDNNPADKEAENDPQFLWVGGHRRILFSS